jgi:hypothetical protein
MLPEFAPAGQPRDRFADAGDRVVAIFRTRLLSETEFAMKRGLAIPIGLSLFGLAVASFVGTRSADRSVVPTQNVAAAPAASSIEMAANDDYLPPLLGIYDDQELAVPGAFAQLTSFSEDAPRPLSLEVLRQASWPAAQPGILMQVGYDNPLPLPMSPSPKVGSALSSNTSILIPDLSDPPSSAGSVIPPLTTSAPITISAPPRFSDSLIRPKPLSMEDPNHLSRVQAAEPPLAGAQPSTALAAPTQVIPSPAPVAAPLQPTPVNLAEFTGCGCQPRIGHTQFGSPCASYCVSETPLCCQSFTTCCQSSCCGGQIIEYPTCCDSQSKWRSFSKIRGWFHGESKGCCGCFEEVCCAPCGSSRKPLFNRFRGLFRKNSHECCCVEPCEIGSARPTCFGE